MPPLSKVSLKCGKISCGNVVKQAVDKASCGNFLQMIQRYPEMWTLGSLHILMWRMHVETSLHTVIWLWKGSFDTQMWLLKRHTDDLLGQKAVILTLGALPSHIFFHSPYFFPPPQGGGQKGKYRPLITALASADSTTFSGRVCLPSLI